jgi:hypothetical protein
MPAAFVSSASANLLRRSQPSSPAHEVFIHILRFRREDVLVKPVIQRDVVMQPAKHGHGHVRMPVDESRQHEMPARIDHLRPAIVRLNLRPRPDRHDGISAHGQTSILINRARPVHSDDSPAAHDEVDSLLVLRDGGTTHNDQNRDPKPNQHFQVSESNASVSQTIVIPSKARHPCSQDVLRVRALEPASKSKE